MSRPLLADPTGVQKSDAAAFHRRVFARWGDRCFFCGVHATDAMHVVPRSQLGKHTRYCRPEENGRPGCRRCHDERKPFPIAVVRAAAKAINRFVDLMHLGDKCKVVVP